MIGIIFKGAFLLAALFWYSIGIWNIINDYFLQEFKTKIEKDLLEIRTTDKYIKIKETFTSQLADKMENILISKSDLKSFVGHEKGNYNSNKFIKNLQIQNDMEENQFCTASSDIEQFYQIFEFSTSNIDIIRTEDLNIQNVMGSGLNWCEIKTDVNTFQIKNKCIFNNEKKSTIGVTSSSQTTSALDAANTADSNCCISRNYDSCIKILKRSKQAVNDISNKINSIELWKNDKNGKCYVEN